MSRAFYILICAMVAAVLAVGMLASDCAAANPGSELGMVDSIGEVTDVIVGHNNRGPYSLSWNNFDSDGISVIINGRALQKGTDYNIDPTSGVISFTSVLINDAMVRVSYRTVPGKSKRSAGGMNIPVTLNLRSGASGNLKMTGLYAQNDPNNPNASKSIIGLGGDRSWGGGKLDSMFLVSQRSEGSPNEGGIWDRAAMKLGGNTSVGMFKFTGAYQHAGQSFDGAKEYQTGLGKEIIDFGTAFAPTKTVQASASFNSSEDTVGDKKGTRSVTNQQSLVYSPMSSTKLSLGHSTVDLTAPGGGKDTVATNSVQLLSTAIKRVTLRSSMTQKTSESFGAEQAFNTGFSAQPINQVGVDVDYGTLANKTVGEQATTDVKVTAMPVKQVAVQAAYSGVDSTNLGQSTKTSVAVQASPLKNVQIQGSAADSADNANQQFQRNLSLSSTPTQFAKLTALLSQKGVNTLDDVTKGAELQLTPGKRTRLLAGYKYIENGTTALTIYDYQADTKPWSFLSLAGSYRQRDLNATTNEVNSAAASMSLSAARFLTLTGQYQANPEDNKGLVQNFNSTSLGLSTHIGSIGVETNYFQKTEYLASRISDEKNVGLALPVFGHGQLTTGCKFGRTLNYSELGTRTYSLGYRHSIGSDFSLALTGNYTQYLQDKVLQPEKTEVSTEVSLGAKF